MGKHAWLFLWTAALLLLTVMVACTAVMVPLNGMLNHVSGVWIALAMDLSDGVFYRPILGEQGYGGVRYMPLHFVLHGGLIALGMSPVHSGYLMTFVCAAGLFGGLYVLMWRLDVGWKLRIPCTLMVVGALAVQLAVMGIRGDLLPAVLNIWGLAFCVAPERKERGPNIPVASLFFALAFLSKVTTVFGFLAACAALFLAGKRKTVWRLVAWTCGAVLFGFGIVYAASGGRVVTTMLVWTSGGTTVLELLTAPLKALANVRDRPTLVLIVFTLAGLLSMGRGAWKELPTIALVATAVVTIAIFGPPGTEYNHFLDLCLIAVVFLAVQVARGRIDTTLGTCLLALIALLGCEMPLVLCSRDVLMQKQHVRRELATVISESREPVLSEDPLLPVLAGRRSYVLDALTLRVICRRRPEVAEDLQGRLHGRHFGAVILMEDPTMPMGRQRYRTTHFGTGFVEALLMGYRPAGRHGPYVVYRPAPQ